MRNYRAVHKIFSKKTFCFQKIIPTVPKKGAFYNTSISGKYFIQFNAKLNNLL